ncbi:MAG: DNA/RNA non-specific endonuclease [Chitinophagales bacterium]|nr:DNA/RNA non-specific endonuclease [Chitinophagales bacterium]MCZ2393965.1 DNA/RNA non-specific endonuclease [Chitinophagales bacterium]
MVRFYSIIIFLVFLFNTSICISQETDVLIDAQKEKLTQQQIQVQNIIDEIEGLKLNKIREQLIHYIPKENNNHEIITHSAMMLSYNEDHEQANWVMHIIPKDVITGTITRTNDFRIDSMVSTGSADVADYWDSGYDRGHLAPSADFRWSKKALSESYYYSNMSPQNPDLNRNGWNNLEIQVREWVVEHGDLLVITGPILKDNLPKIQQGSFRVSIPEAYYKIIVDINSPSIQAIAFLYPNAPVTGPVAKYMVSIDSIESLSGINFFPNIPDAESFESTIDIQNWKFSKTQISEAPNLKYDLNHIPTRQATYFVGTECNVCGKVVGTRYNKNTSTAITYINFDEPYPNSPFSVVVFGKDRVNFTYEPEVYLNGKMICIKGMVQLYKGKPQIVATSEKQFSLYQK